MNTLTKQDYENLIKILETVEIKGSASAKYIIGLGERLGEAVEHYNAPSFGKIVVPVKDNE